MSTINVDTIQTRLGGQAVTSANFAKAWTQWNGTGTAVINQSVNTASLVDNGTGDFTLNLTTAFADTNHGHTGAGGTQATGGIADIDLSRANSSASALRIETVRGSTNTKTDFAMNMVAMHGSLAS